MLHETHKNIECNKNGNKIETLNSRQHITEKITYIQGAIKGTNCRWQTKSTKNTRLLYQPHTNSTIKALAKSMRLNAQINPHVQKYIYTVNIYLKRFVVGTNNSDTTTATTSVYYFCSYSSVRNTSKMPSNIQCKNIYKSLM